MIYFDDQDEHLEIMRDLLQNSFEVICSNNPLEYTELLERHNPLAILIDIHMPMMDGHQLAKAVLSHHFYNGCPIIFISGDPSDQNMLKSFKQGGVDFFNRAMHASEMETRLQNLVKLYLERSVNFKMGNLELNFESMMLKLDEKRIDLTLNEIRILGQILRALPRSLTRNQLIKKVWGEREIKVGTINTHLSNLKNKISEWDYGIKVRDENILVLKKEDF